MSCHRPSSAAGDMRVSVCGSPPRGGRHGSLVRDQATGDRERGVGGAGGGGILDSAGRRRRARRLRSAPTRSRRRPRPAAAPASIRDAQLPGHPVALDAVVEPGRDDEEVLGHPRPPSTVDALADERLGEVLAGRGRRRRAAAPPRSRRAASGRSAIARPSCHCPSHANTPATTRHSAAARSTAAAA